MSNTSVAPLAAAAAASPSSTPLLPTTAAASTLTNVTAGASASALTPAAAARAKKLAAGGMDFVERPGGVYVSPRNLAPPPPAKVVDSLSSSVVSSIPSSSSLSSPPAAVAVAPFSFLRWYCTSRTGWAWTVRGITIAIIIATTYVAWQYYRAWRRRMERWHASRRIKSVDATTITAPPPPLHTSLPSSASSSPSPSSASVPLSSVSTMVDGARNFRSLAELIATRTAMLQQYADLMRHIRVEIDDDPSIDLTPSVATKRIKAVFDELDATLAENVYLKGLLKRISGSLKKSNTTTTTTTPHTEAAPSTTDSK